ncbi:PEPxxWA-CTERM sorting domain-containing protein [Erythrobacter sp. 3-20A1M]|uniref:PEPxxWA-CTERM sorting domain-containing protein n=1 Tax=Erythrobacter sp. 3-20A1M TaxID=2653850 RepID=UPI00203B95D7|nr:PEPxxWA-CTERM sorting domain-containing protein [Erythrobacter sp. 3-20A1M]
MRKISINRAILLTTSALALGLTATTAQAAPFIVKLNSDFSDTPVSFRFMGGTFTFSGTGDIFGPLAVSTRGNAAVRNVFGSPSVDFVNRGTVTYDDSTLGGYGSFPRATAAPYSNGDNFLGLRVGSAGNYFYGFAYTTNTTLNSFGFQTTPNTAITATAGGVPEPATWALMLLGFGALGWAMRSRKPRLRSAGLSYA